MTTPWSPDDAGVLELPSGRRVRGRALRRPLPHGVEPTFGIYLLGRPPALAAWDVRWVRWPDFRLPADPDDARAALLDLWARAAGQRVEVACGGGRGRTGTALACLAVLDGVPPDEAVAYVRRHYDARAVETPWQRRYVERFAPHEQSGRRAASAGGALVPYEWDDDPARVDRDALWSFLSTSAYWGRWRSRHQVEQQLASTWRVVGCYERSTGSMVGFARAVSDGVSFAYLADVYVLPAHRGRGLGTRLVHHMVDAGPGRDLRWVLHTSDAHDLYRPFGFTEPDATLLERPRPDQPPDG